MVPKFWGVLKLTDLLSLNSSLFFELRRPKKNYYFREEQVGGDLVEDE